MHKYTPHLLNSIYYAVADGSSSFEEACRAMNLKPEWVAPRLYRHLQESPVKRFSKLLEEQLGKYIELQATVVKQGEIIEYWHNRGIGNHNGNHNHTTKTEIQQMPETQHGNGDQTSFRYLPATRIPNSIDILHRNKVNTILSLLENERPVGYEIGKITQYKDRIFVHLKNERRLNGKMVEEDFTTHMTSAMTKANLDHLVFLAEVSYFSPNAIRIEFLPDGETAKNQLSIFLQAYAKILTKDYEK